jgi:hypothetical protein
MGWAPPSSATISARADAGRQATANIAAADTAGKAEDVTKKIKDGNKADVDPLLLENKTGGGRFVDAFSTWNHLFQQFGGGTTKPATGNSTGGAPVVLTQPVAGQAPTG